MSERNCANRLGLSEEARAVEEYTEAVKGEIAEKAAGKVWSLRGLRLYECPLSYVTGETSRVARLVYLIDGSGRLFYPGGWADQPAWLVEAYEIFISERAAGIREEDNG